MMLIILYFLSAFVRIVLITAFVVTIYLLINSLNNRIMRTDNEDKDIRN
jgi:hypothetical protein